MQTQEWIHRRMSTSRHRKEHCTLGPKRPATPGKPISPESPCAESKTRWCEWSQDTGAARPPWQMPVSRGVEWIGICALCQRSRQNLVPSPPVMIYTQELLSVSRPPSLLTETLHWQLRRKSFHTTNFYSFLFYVNACIYFSCHTAPAQSAAQHW